jgi:hypothetical protein
MVGAGEELGVASISATHAIAAVAAYIQMRAQAAIQIAAENHRLFAHVARDKITGPGYLAFVAKVEPAARENALALQLVNLAIGEDAPVKETTFGID